MISGIISVLVPFLTKAGEKFSEEAGKAIWDKLKSYFSDAEEKEVITHIENGNDDSSTLNTLKVILENKIQQDDKLKDILKELTDKYAEIIEKALEQTPYRFDTQSGDVINGNKVYVETIIINNYAKHSDRDFDIASTLSDLSKLGIKDTKAIEGKLFTIRFHLADKNFSKALSLCDEIIDLYAIIPEVWEYKAICTYLISTDKYDIIKTSARTIILCLNQAQEAARIEGTTSGRKSFEEISMEISERYFSNLINRINKSLSNSQGKAQKAALHKLILELDTCYKIYPDTRYLKEYLKYLSGNMGFTWLFLDSAEVHEKSYIYHDGLEVSDLSPTNLRVQTLIEAASKKINDPSYTMPEVKFYSARYDKIIGLEEFRAKTKSKILGEIESNKMALKEKSDRRTYIIARISYLSGFFEQLISVFSGNNEVHDLKSELKDIETEIEEHKELIKIGKDLLSQYYK